MQLVTSFCESCRLQRPLRDFDLGSGQLSATCLACAHERSRTEDLVARSLRHAQIAALETQRRSLIAALAKIDDDLRAHPNVALEKQRRSLIAALVKIDAEIAELLARPSSPSVPFARVDPSDVFEGADISDTDLGYGD